MRVLYLIPRPFFPPLSGNANLTYNLLLFMTRELTADLVILVECREEEERVEEIVRAALPSVNSVRTFQMSRDMQARARELRDLIFHGIPTSISRYVQNDLMKWLQRNVVPERYDIVHFDMFHMIPYLSSCRGTPTVLMSSDAYSMGMASAKRIVRKPSQRIALLIRKMLFQRLELTAYRTFTKVCTVSDVDSEYLRQHVPGLDVETIGIPINEEFLRHGQSVNERIRETVSPALLCVGNFSIDGLAHEAIRFLDGVYEPLTRSSWPPLLTVLGNNPTPALRRRIQQFPLARHVDYVESYADFLAQDWVYVYPQRCGSGVQTKVQQAMAVGLPVVGFRVAFAGLGVQDGVHCFMCDSYGEMRGRLSELFSNPSLRHAIGRAGSLKMRQSFSIEKVGTCMLELYKKAIDKHRAR